MTMFPGRLAALATSAGLLAAACQLTQTQEAQVPGASVNSGFPAREFVDQTRFWDSAQAWSASAESRRVTVEGDMLVLADPRERAFPKNGLWTSEVIETEFPITELLPSWNIELPENTGARFEVRTRDGRSGDWSPWLHIGFWGDVERRPDRDVEFDHGRVRIDVLRLTRPATAFQLRAHLESYAIGSTEPVGITRLAAVYSGPIDETDWRPAPVIVRGNWARDLGLPFRTQQDNPVDVSGSTCSPTSVSMVLHHWGVDRTTMENALAIYDPEWGLFGNWNRAVAYASEVGLEGHLTRIRTWDEVKAHIAEGQPLIASISFREGEFPSNVIRRTGGHLIVVRGLTPEGDAIVNDPASRDRGDGVVYVAEELARAWFGHGGVAYVIRPPGEATGQ